MNGAYLTRGSQRDPSPGKPERLDAHTGIRIRSKVNGTWRNINLRVIRSRSGNLMLVRDDGFDLLYREDALALAEFLIREYRR